MFHSYVTFEDEVVFILSLSLTWVGNSLCSLVYLDIKILRYVIGGVFIY